MKTRSMPVVDSESPRDKKRKDVARKILLAIVDGGGGGFGCDDDDGDDSLYNEEEQTYYDSLPPKKRRDIDKKESMLCDLRKESSAAPLRFRLLESGMPIGMVSAMLDRIESSGGDEKSLKFVTDLMRIPFSKFAKLSVGPESGKSEVAEFLARVQETLDEEIYGMGDVKKLFMMAAAKWIGRPESRGIVLGLRGPAGVGKTTLVKNGLGRALGIPSAFITLGSANDSAFLDGHS
jgi:hypothetical protein